MTDVTKPAARSPEDRQLAEERVERSRQDGVELVGPGGLLSELTKNVLEASPEAEMSEHPGSKRSRRSPRRPLLVPAEFVESLFVHAKVMGDLVEDGHPDLLA